VEHTPFFATKQYEASRDTIANFTHASSRNGIIFTSSATEALNLIAVTSAWANINKGDEILITDLEYHSKIVPWQILDKEKGSILKYIPLGIAMGYLDWSSCSSLLTPNTKIFPLQHVSNTMRSITPLATITPIFRAIAYPTMKIILDAYQSIPHMPVNVQHGLNFVGEEGGVECCATVYGRWRDYG